MKSSKNSRFFDDFKGNRSELICLNILNIKSKIWKRLRSMMRTQRIVFWLVILRNLSCKLALQSESQNVSLPVNDQLNRRNSGKKVQAMSLFPFFITRIIVFCFYVSRCWILAPRVIYFFILYCTWMILLNLIKETLKH